MVARSGLGPVDTRPAQAHDAPAYTPRSIYRKLNVSSRCEASLGAVKSGLADPDDWSDQGLTTFGLTPPRNWTKDRSKRSVFIASKSVLPVNTVPLLANVL